MRAGILTLVLLTASSVATASSHGPDEDDAKPWRIGLGAGVSLPMGPDALTDNFKAGSSFKAYFTREIRDGIGLRFEFAHDENDCDLPGCADVSGAKGQWSRFSGGVQFARPMNDTIDGHLFFLLGVYDQEVEVDVTLNPLQLVRLSRDTTLFGLAFGGGADFHLGDDWGLGADVHVHSVFQDGDRDTVWFVSPTGHFFWTF